MTLLISILKQQAVSFYSVPICRRMGYPNSVGTTEILKYGYSVLPLLYTDWFSEIQTQYGLQFEETIDQIRPSH